MDTDGKGLEEITAEGIVFEGKLYEVDCIIFATGFEVEPITAEGLDIKFMH